MAPRIGIGIGVGRRRLGEAYPSILDDGNTVAWFDMAEKYMTKDGSERVSQWADRSGNDNHLLQAGADAIKPTWSSDGVLTDGVDDFMDKAFTLIQPEQIYIVFKQVTRPGTRYIFDGMTSASGAIYQGTAPILNAYAGSASPNNDNLALDTWGVGILLFNGASSEFVINDTDPVTGDFGAGVMNGFTLGGRATGVSNSNIQVKEIIIRKIADTSGSKNAIRNYLSDRYGIYQDLGEVVPVIVGEEITIYGDEVANVPISNNLSVTYTCDIGTQVGNNYVIDAVTGDIGDVYLYIKATNAGEVIRRTRTKLVVAAKTNTGSKTITIIGDSLVALGGDEELEEVRLIFDSMTWTGIGTQSTAPSLREGYPSTTYDWLVNDAASPFTKAGVVDIPAYFTDNGLAVPDFIYLRMGVNDAWNERTGSWTDAEKATWLADISELVDAFLAHDANLKIIIALPTVCVDSTEGWEASYPSDPYQDSYITIIHQMRDAIVEIYSDYDIRVTVGYATWLLDRNDGYPKTGGVHTNAVHPDEAGYFELGEGMASSLNALL